MAGSGGFHMVYIAASNAQGYDRDQLRRTAAPAMDWLLERQQAIEKNLILSRIQAGPSPGCRG
jgi:hypothetical protein